MAVSGFGVWALVGQQIVKDLSAVILLWNLSAWRPRFEFSWKHLRELMGFSTSNFISQLAIFFDAQAGAILMGTLFGPIPVGLARLAIPDALMKNFGFADCGVYGEVIGAGDIAIGDPLHA